MSGSVEPNCSGNCRGSIALLCSPKDRKSLLHARHWQTVIITWIYLLYLSYRLCWGAMSISQNLLRKGQGVVFQGSLPVTIKVVASRSHCAVSKQCIISLIYIKPNISLWISGTAFLCPEPIFHMLNSQSECFHNISQNVARSLPWRSNVLIKSVFLNLCQSTKSVFKYLNKWGLAYTGTNDLFHATEPCCSPRGVLCYPYRSARQWRRRKPRQ